MPRLTLRTTFMVMIVLMLACAAKPVTSRVSDGPSPALSAGVGDGAGAQPAKAALGQTITVSGGLGNEKLAYTVTKATSYKAAADNAYIKPAKGVYLAITVQILVVEGKTYACGCDFAVLAADGSLYEPGWGVGFNEVMPSVTLNRGEKTSGLVVFDIPAASVKGAVVQLRPDWTNDIRGTWTT